LIIIFENNIFSAFQNPKSEDSFYWIIGTIMICSLFLIIAFYNIFNFKKPNITKKSKIQAIFLMPLLIITPITGIIILNFEKIPDIRGPYLSWMMNPSSTMTISFELKQPKDFNIEYKKETDLNYISKPITRFEKREYDGYYHYSVNLTELDANCVYLYRISGFTKDTYSFRTAPEYKDITFKFILYGDTREYSKVFDNQHIQLVQQMIKEQNLTQISFVINTGDLATSYDDIKSWNLHFYAIRDLASKIPYFVASGNHEWNSEVPWYDTSHQPAIDIQDFPSSDDSSHNVYSLNETSYAFGYGNAYFIFLGYPHAGCNKTEYLNWLEYQLKIANGTIGDGYNFIFIINHRPPFDRRDDSYNDAVDIIKSELPMIFYSGVDAFISGHNHVLAIQNITWSGDPLFPNSRNMTFLISGGGGAPLRNPKYGIWENNYSMGFYGKTIYCKRSFHYYLVEVNPIENTIKFDCFELNSGYLPEASFIYRK